MRERSEEREMTGERIIMPGSGRVIDLPPGEYHLCYDHEASQWVFYDNDNTFYRPTEPERPDTT